MQIITLSASANKLSNIQKQAEEYAALIMEELDPDNHGYIMVKKREIKLCPLFLFVIGHWFMFDYCSKKR